MSLQGNEIDSELAGVHFVHLLPRSSLRKAETDNARESTKELLNTNATSSLSPRGQQLK